jgi:DNA-binding protein YbaB
MFGLNSMMEKMAGAKTKVEETKKRLDQVYVYGENNQKSIKVIASANKEIKEISIANELHELNKGELQLQLTQAVNDALQKANAVYEAEMQAVLKDTVPNIPGLNAMFK